MVKVVLDSEYLQWCECVLSKSLLIPKGMVARDGVL